MSEKVLAALKTAPSTTELRELDLPDMPPDAALMRVEVAGVCGTDVSQYKLPLRGGPLIMGHENVGYLARVGSRFAKRQGVKEGDLMFLEHYLPCGHCEWDHMGEYRHCAATEWFYDPKAIRYGYTSTDIPPALWGGFSHYLYLPLNAVLHKVPAGLTPEEAGPRDADVERHPVGAHRRRRRLRQLRADPGPGQQGLCCVMASKQAGADKIIVTGTARDARRLEVAKALGRRRHHRRRARKIRSRASRKSPDGRGVDVVIDCTVGGRHGADAPRHRGDEAPRRHDGGAGRRQPEVPRLPDRPPDAQGDDAEERARPLLPRPSRWRCSCSPPSASRST